ncbi:MAG: ribonuclease J [Clostridia bacterium]|nr:ribonuclease J [Clostridia bacterium]
MPKKTKKTTRAAGKKASPVRIIPLGGLGEIGRNMTVVEYADEIIVVDAGLGFPDESMLGVDLVIPDTQYLEENAEKIKGILLTHGHEDHIGAIPYMFRFVNAPIYGTLLTLGILEGKLEEHGLEAEAELNQVNSGDTIQLGKYFTAEFIRVNHSIADSCAIAVTCPAGTIVFTGDFKIDLTPIQGEPINLTRFGEIGKNGVLALLCESTNAERPGFTMSERKVGKSLDNIIKGCDKRIIISTFSSNVHRVQQIINYSHKYGRKVALTGRSMINVINAAQKFDYMDIPKGTLIDINEIDRFKPEQLTIVTTGSQGEPMSALYKMAFSEHDKVSLSSSDLVIISATTIPGNEKLVTKIINELLKKGVTLLNDAVADVHVSGHACQEELKIMQSLLKPKYFIPVHGEYRHLKANAELALEMGMKPSNIIIPELGMVIELTEKTSKTSEKVASGKVLIDGLGIGDVGSVVLRDRRHLAQDGLIVVVAAVSLETKEIISGPDIVSRGFVYVKENEELMENLKTIAYDTIQKCFDDEVDEWNIIKGKIKDSLTTNIYNITKRKPMILPVIMDI